MHPTLPNFLIIGAAKAATSSLHRYIGQHPQVFTTAKKETNFFAYQGGMPDYHWWGEAPVALLASTTTQEEYRTHFSAVRDELAIGESSPLYLYHPDAANNIMRLIPDVRLIAILRDPVERAYSHFLHLRRDGREPCDDFTEALEQEAHRIRQGWTWDYFYRDMGFYHLQLERYLNCFDRSQIKIVLYEDVKSDVHAVLREIFEFLGVDPTFTPNTIARLNASGIPRNRSLYNLLTRSAVIRSTAQLVMGESLRKSIGRKLIQGSLQRPQLSLEVRDLLINDYRNDIFALQSAFELNLDHWLTVRSEKAATKENSSLG